MYLKCLACEALARLAATCPLRDHNTPWTSELFRLGGTATLRICARVSSLPSIARQMMLNATTMLSFSPMGCVVGRPMALSPEGYLVIPRAADCITLFLGGRARYQQQFSDHPGTYWYVRIARRTQDREYGTIPRRRRLR